MKRSVIFLLLIVGILWGCTGIKKQESAVPLHFSLNDSLLQNPVALIFHEDNYHLFYSYTKDGEGEKLGQAESTDLVHWQNKPMNFETGQISTQNLKSVVIDWNHTTEFGGDNPALIALGVSDDQFGELTLSYSEDNGAGWKQYSDEPIILEDYYQPIRDLKVIWNDDVEKWLMLVLSGYEVRFYSSDNLINWEYVSRFGEDVYRKSGEWTKLDFFPMELAETSEMKWVLFISADSGSPNEGSGVQYFVGDFDGYVYHASHNKPKWVDHGSDLYQAVILSDYLGSNKAPVLIGSIYNSIYTKFNIEPKESGVFSLVRELTFKEKFNDYYLVSQPVKGIETIENKRDLLGETELTEGVKIERKQQLPLRIDLTFDVNNRLYLGLAETFGVKIQNQDGKELMLGYQVERRYFFIADPTIKNDFPDTWDGFNYAPYVTNEPLMDMTLIVDRNSAELFAMNGLISLSRQYAFDGEPVHVQIFGEKGKVRLLEGALTEY